MTPAQQTGTFLNRKVTTLKKSGRRARTPPKTPTQLANLPAPSRSRKRAHRGGIDSSRSAKKRNILGFYRFGDSKDKDDNGKHWSVLQPNLLGFPDWKYTLHEQILVSNPWHIGATDGQSLQLFVDGLSVGERARYESIVVHSERFRSESVREIKRLHLRRIKHYQRDERREEEHREQVIANGEVVEITDDEESKKEIRVRPKKRNHRTSDESSPKSK